MNDTQLKPSLLCRLIGHKWWLKNFQDSLDDKGGRHRDVKWKEVSHCDRCGIKNPRWSE